MKDLCFALRRLWKSPGFTVVAILTFALGVGATTTIFTLIQGVLPTPPPYRQPDRLVLINPVRTDGQRYTRGWPAAQWLEWQKESRTMESIAAYGWTFNFLVLPDGSESIEGMRVTPDYFKVLGIHPVLGRPFDESDTKSDTSTAVIIGHDLWRGRFHGDTNIIGQTVQISRYPHRHTVIGDPSNELKAGSRAAGIGRIERRLLGGVAATQIALTLALLFGASLLIQTVRSLAKVRPGYDTRHVLTMSVTSVGTNASGFHALAIERVAGLPGVEAAAFGWGVPLTGNQWENTFEIDGRTGGATEKDRIVLPSRSVTPDYFAALRLRLVDGRAFRPTDDALAACLLAAVGIYGVLSMAVGSRRSEIAIRMTVGAGRGDVLRLMLGDGLRLTVVGVGLGLVVALVLSAGLKTYLFGIGKADPWTLVAMVALVMVITLAASWIPARRASRVDPLEALRCEG